MTLSQYVNNRLTRWDKFKLRFFWTPAVMLMLFIMYGLTLGGGDFTFQQGRIFLIIWIPIAVVAVVFHQSATKKVNELKEAWEERYRR